MPWVLHLLYSRWEGEELHTYVVCTNGEHCVACIRSPISKLLSRMRSGSWIILLSMWRLSLSSLFRARKVQHLREINADTLYVTVDVLNRIRVTAGIVVEINVMPASKKMPRFGGTKIIILCIVLPNLAACRRWRQVGPRSKERKPPDEQKKNIRGAIHNIAHKIPSLSFVVVVQVYSFNCIYSVVVHTSHVKHRRQYLVTLFTS
jgi:hypothetical protein